MVEQKTEFKLLVRIANTDLDGNKKIISAIRKIKGVGFQFANAVCISASIPKDKRTGELSDQEVLKIEQVVTNPSNFGVPSWLLNRRKDPEDGTDKHLIKGDLDFVKDNDIKIMKKIRSYKGVRHIYGLPCRGQRTKSNFRKNKGKVQGVKKNPKSKSGKT